MTLHNISLSQLPLIPGQAVNGGLVAPNGVQQDMYMPTIISYNLRIEQELTPNTVFAVSYVGSHGYHETLSADLNQAVPIICPAPSCPANLAPGAIYHPAGEPLANPQLGNGWTWISNADTSYNSLQADFRKRFSHGFDFRAVYTWSKSLDDGDSLNAGGADNAPGLAEDARNLRLDWGRSTFDVRNAASMNALCQLPLGAGKRFLAHVRGAEGIFVNNWTFGSIFSYRAAIRSRRS